MKFRHFLGIDVSKQTLDICILRDGKIVKQLRIKNLSREIRKTFSRLQKEGFAIEETLCCMEHTGIYNNLLLFYFQELGYTVWVESARQIKLSMGMLRGKSDKLDASRIAQYVYKNQMSLKVWKPKREILEKLQALLKNRNRLLKIKNQLSTFIKESKNFIA